MHNSGPQEKHYFQLTVQRCETRIITITACALQGIAARWLSAHYKDIARHSARYGAIALGVLGL